MKSRSAEGCSSSRLRQGPFGGWYRGPYSSETLSTSHERTCELQLRCGDSGCRRAIRAFNGQLQHSVYTIHLLHGGIALDDCLNQCGGEGKKRIGCYVFCCTHWPRPLF